MKQRKSALERELERHSAVCAMVDQANKDKARIAQLEAELAEARKDGERRRVALEEVLDALGALSNPSELAGWAIDDDRAAAIIELARGTR